jgi:hypothetical protein
MNCHLYALFFPLRYYKANELQLPDDQKLKW